MQRRQRGVALLTAIILVALATVLAVAIAFHSAMTARRGVSSFTIEQGLQFGGGAEVIAGYALVQDAKPRGGQQGPQRDNDGEAWTQPIPPTEVAPGITFEAVLRDESGKFNLNTLVNPLDRTPDRESLDIFKQLLAVLGIETRFADVMADFLDDDGIQLASGAEDSVYTSQKPPYRAPNAPITSVSELMAMPGFSREDYLKLAPNVSALPPMERRINVCFAPAAVLDALISHYSGSLSQEYTKSDPEQFAELNRGKCGTTADVVGKAVDGATERDALLKRIGEQSTYFRLHTWVTIGTTRFALYSLMERQGSQVRVVNRTFGTE